MDGSVSTSLAERTRLQISRSFVNRTANEANAQSELFEQLLGLSFTVQPPPDKEPEALDTDSSIGDTSSTSVDEDTKVEEEKALEPSIAVVATQAAPLIIENAAELGSDRSILQTHTDAKTSNAAELGSAVVNEQPATKTDDSDVSADNGNRVDRNAIVDTGASQQVLAKVDEQVAIADTQSALSRVEPPKRAADSNRDVSTATSENDDDDKHSRKALLTTTKVDDGQAHSSQELTVKNAGQSSVDPVPEAEREIAQEPVAANTQEEDSKAQRGNRREKWFEDNGQVNGASPLDRSTEPSSSNPASENVNLAKILKDESAAQAATLIGTSASQTPVAAISPVPVAPPAAWSVAPQNISSTLTPTATSAASPESSTAVHAAPSRSVGNQPAKPNGKEKASEPSLTQQERVRVIQRIARSFNRISAEGGTINLRLHPEHLGSVSVQVRLEGRSLAARLSTETEAARDAIMQDLPALRQRLADQGFDVTKFQVDIAGHGADASFGQTAGQSQSENHSSGTQTANRRAATREARAAAIRQLMPATTPTWQSGTGIDLQA